MKQAQLSLETARELYKEGGAGKAFALDNFEESLLNNKLVEKYEDLNHVEGYFIDIGSRISDKNTYKSALRNRNIFYTEKQAKKALAMAQLSQLMKQANGDWKLDWNNDSFKYTIFRNGNLIYGSSTIHTYHFLAFRSSEIRDHFLRYHDRLIKDYFEID